MKRRCAMGWLWLGVFALMAACSSSGSGPDDGATDSRPVDTGALDTGGDATDGDAGTADSGSSDSGRSDASVPAADFVESSADDNDGYLGGTPEASGLTLTSGAALTIEASVSDHAANEVWVDSDMFTFTVSTTTLATAELDVAEDSGVWSVALLAPDLSFVAWWGISSTGHASTAPVELTPGDYIVHVAQGANAAAPSPPYRITLNARDRSGCVEATGAASFTETTEGEGSRDNDVAAVRWAGFPAASLAGGAAQATGLTVEAGSTVAIDGVSDAVDPDGDEYFDRDAFEVTAGAMTTELHVRVDHGTANVDLDLFLFAQSDATRIVAAGGAFGFGPDELVAPVTPGARYLLWVGSRVRLPAERVDYRVTTCAR